MPLMIIALIATSVAMGALAQILLKQGMSQDGVQSALAKGAVLDLLLTVISTWQVVAGISLYAGSMVVWLAVLSRIDVTQAYPFVGLGFLITLAFGYFYLGEPVNGMRLLGTILVASGVVLVASS